MPSSICQVCASPVPMGMSRCVTHRRSRPRRPRGSTRKWRDTRERVLKRDRFICGYCGRRANTVDHVIPVDRGGTDALGNLVAACDDCNSSKREQTVQEWTRSDSR